MLWCWQVLRWKKSVTCTSTLSDVHAVYRIYPRLFVFVCCFQQCVIIRTHYSFPKTQLVDNTDVCFLYYFDIFVLALLFGVGSTNNPTYSICSCTVVTYIIMYLKKSKPEPKSVLLDLQTHSSCIICFQIQQTYRAFAPFIYSWIGWVCDFLYPSHTLHSCIVMIMLMQRCRILLSLYVTDPHVQMFCFPMFNHRCWFWCSPAAHSLVHRPQTHTRVSLPSSQI